MNLEQDTNITKQNKETVKPKQNTPPNGNPNAINGKSKTNRASTEQTIQSGTMNSTQHDRHKHMG